MFLKLLIDGSCSAITSIPFLARAALEMRSCWHICDLLTFCCQMDRAPDSAVEVVVFRADAFGVLDIRSKLRGLG